MTVTPRNLAELRAVEGLEDTIRAADAYVAARQEAIREALAIRNAAIRGLADACGPAEAARRAGRSAGFVKALRRSSG